MTRDPYSILLFQWIAEKGLWKKQSSDTPGRALGLHLLNSAGKNKRLHPATASLTDGNSSFNLLFGKYLVYFSTSFPSCFFATIPHDHLQQLLGLIHPGLAWGGPGHKARRRQDKCSRNAAPEGRAAWCTHGRCVLGSSRKEGMRRVVVKQKSKEACALGWRVKSQGFEGFYSSMVCSLWKFIRLQYTYKPNKVWFSSAIEAESVAWAICALNARRFLTSFCSCKCLACR